MRKIKYIIIVFLFSLCVNVKAVDDCTSEEMNRLRNLANKVEFKLDYSVIEREEEVDGEKQVVDIWVKYKINIINDNQDLKYYLKRSFDEENILVNSDNLLEYNFSNGEKITFKIYSYTTNLCTNEILRTINYNFPDFNKYYYYNKDKCQKYPEFKYCKEFMKVNKNDDEIDKLFENYINEKEGTNSSSTINSLVKNNKYIIIGIAFLIIIGIIVFIIINKKNKEEKI